MTPVGLRTQDALGPRPIGNWVGGPWERPFHVRTVFISKRYGKSGRHTREGMK